MCSSQVTRLCHWVSLKVLLSVPGLKETPSSFAPRSAFRCLSLTAMSFAGSLSRQTEVAVREYCSRVLREFKGGWQLAARNFQ